ncbi:MAG: DUF3568 family protein [Proteobacteria bacterium]|nr:DUF3568 family protein [Pseudomonadota bacterium]
MKSLTYLVMGLLLPILLIYGCTPAVVGIGGGSGLGTYSYVKGELKVLYPFPYDRTWDASLTALEKLNINVTSQQRDALNGRIKGRRGDGKGVLIKIENKGLDVTEVGIRVGTFGDQDASRKIQQTIINVLQG